MQNNITNLIYPEIFFLITTLILFFSHIESFKKEKTHSPKELKLYINTTVGFAIVTLLLYINSTALYSLFDDSYISTETTLFLKMLILVIFITYLLFFKNSIILNGIRSIELIFTLSIFVLSLFLAIGANDFIWLYLSLEIGTTAVYGLLLIKRKSTGSIESTIRYFIATSMITIVFLLAVSLLYLQAGTVNFSELQLLFSFIEMNNTDIVAFTILLVSIIAKLGAAPLHVWMLDAYKNLSYSTLFFLLIFPKLLLIYILLIFYQTYYLLLIPVVPAVACFIFTTTLLGVCFALYQFKLKNILIFSSISSISFFLIGLCVGSSQWNTILFYFLIIYIINIMGVFMCIDVFRSWSIDNELKNINDFANLFRTNPVLAIMFSSFLFSLAGLPPFPGFLYKFHFLSLFILNNNAGFYFILMALYVVSSFYYLRLIKLIFTNKNNKWIQLRPIEKTRAVLIGLLFALNLSSFLFQDLILQWLSSVIC